MRSVPAFGLLAAALLGPTPALAAPPNVIVVMTDDMGYGDLSCHGNPVVKTPHLDRLHGQSVRLTDFHVAPMCTPTRGQLLTGMDALRNGAASVSAGRSFVRRGIPTMADAFAAAGYRTALYGKWHLGDSAPHLPHHRGFHDAVYHLGWGITSMADTWQNDCFDGRFFHNGTLKPYPGYCTDVFFNLGMDWVRRCKQEGQPFFLYLPTNAPHAPHWVPDADKAPYRGQRAPAFFAMIANIDANFGRLDALLREQGLWDDTIVVYLHDNGGTAGVQIYNAGLRGRKTTMYEGGHRAPCFVRWPAGKLRPAGDLNGLTQVQDLMPTLLDLCGVPAPAAARFDGASLAGYLKGTTNTLPDRTLVVQYGEQPNGRKLEKWHSAVLRDKWRLVHGTELYDLRADPAQATDLAAKHPDVLARLREHYERWWAGVEPGLSNFEPVSIGADVENPVTLTSADWATVYCDNMNNLREGVQRNGAWHLLVEKDGTYEIELRRWPRPADAALAAPVPAFRAKDGGLPAGKALPVARVRLRLGAFEQERPVAAGDKSVSFSLPLKAGKTTMQTWLLDADGKELSGAYFAYVNRR